MSAQRRELGALARKLRKSAGRSMGDVAQSLGVSVTCVSDWERGLSALPIETVEAVARCLDLDAGSAWQLQCMAERAWRHG